MKGMRRCLPPKNPLHAWLPLDTPARAQHHLVENSSCRELSGLLGCCIKTAERDHGRRNGSVGGAQGPEAAVVTAGMALQIQHTPESLQGTALRSQATCRQAMGGFFRRAKGFAV
jgi:hypothetical protein